MMDEGIRTTYLKVLVDKKQIIGCRFYDRFMRIQYDEFCYTWIITGAVNKKNINI